MLGITRPIHHRTILHVAAVPERSPAPWFAPPVPAIAREPGTNWFSIVTSESNRGGH